MKTIYKTVLTCNFVGSIFPSFVKLKAIEIMLVFNHCYMGLNV